MKKPKISGRELDIMNILWESKEPLIASEIAAADEQLSISTVQVVLKRLLEKEYIRIADIVHSGKVLSREYEAVKKPQDFLTDELGDIMRRYKTFSIFRMDVMAALVKEEENDSQLLKELEALIEKRKAELGIKEET